MIRKIIITIISILLSISLFIVPIAPLLPPLEPDGKFSLETIRIIMLTGLIVSFILATILILICVFWKDKTKMELYVLNERGELCPYSKEEE